MSEIRKIKKKLSLYLQVVNDGVIQTWLHPHEMKLNFCMHLLENQLIWQTIYVFISLCPGADDSSFKQISFVILNSHCQKSWRSNKTKIVFSFMCYAPHYIQHHVQCKLNKQIPTITKQTKEWKNYILCTLHTIFSKWYNNSLFCFKNFSLYIFYPHHYHYTKFESVICGGIFTFVCVF